ncbi:F-box domain-containing protein [Mucor velutinosus]|uniref:F-box domain-containing protein n=1 Tax=Mucor velutinosus TaxID=708070 RepID=A0AAN7DG91_9FUNG|nr:F-box domain-containing protein [Mucor velutinosus]
MPRPFEPVLTERDPLMIHHHPHYPAANLKLDGKIDLSKQPSFLPRPELQQRSPVQPQQQVSWEITIEKCIKSIVSIKSCRTRGLDTELPGSFTATGFVVDPEQGIILSNRHVVSVSPIKAYAVLCNYEEIELTPIYRDPEHDFGFFRYDPCKVRFLDIPGIDLFPKGAKVGQDIRVVGNDAGEKLSILSGTLARLDRDAPSYGLGEYNDLNTFYYQAASSTSTGSSGSPVLDIQGRAIALNAGGASTSSSSYYLPLDRAQRALSLIQDGSNTIPRGTIQTTFEYQSYDALLQLGLSRHLEQRLRSQSQQQQNKNTVNEGLLVVKSVLLDGPAYGHLEPGDILLTCNGKLLPRLFVDLEEHLDNCIESQLDIHLVVSRAGELKEITVAVQDLHAITPWRFLEFGGGVLNDVSYQMARSYGISLKDPGVYVGTAGFLLGSARALRGSIIVGINNRLVTSLDDFVAVVSEIEQGKRVPIRFYTLARPMKMRIMIVHMDWRWHKFQMATRNDATGYWDYKVLETPLHRSSAASLMRNDQLCKQVDDKLEDPIESLKKSIVSVDCYPPFVVDGSKNPHSYGAGVIVSLNPPLIVCDRDTVPISINVISLTFDNSLTISADLVFLHPFYNFAVLKFDPTPVIEAGIKMKAATLNDQDFQVGDQVTYVGLSGRSDIDIKKTTISSLGAIRTTETSPPRWRAINVEAFKVSDGTLASQGGLFADHTGGVRALWMSFSIENAQRQLSSVLGGLSSRLIMPVIRKLKSGQAPIVRGLDVEIGTLQISHARLIGVSHDWITKIKSKATDKQPSVLYVLGITDISSLSGQQLKPGDILLTINDTIVTNISDIGYFHDQEALRLTILRDGQELNLVVPTTSFDGKETTEVIGWQGMVIQDTYASAKEQIQKQVPEGVYLSCCLYGSPAQASLMPGIWITEVGQTPVKTLQEFLQIVDPSSIAIRQSKKLQKDQVKQGVFEKQQDGHAASLLALPTQDEIEDDKLSHDDNHIQIKFVRANNMVQVKAIKLDRHYWPTWHIKKNESSALGWDMTFL